jgi:hypothetical protein
MWQAVKPLIEFVDEMGIQQRDLSMKVAIEEHQWDMVDHCQLRCYADINKHEPYDDNPLKTAAKNRDWEAVEELVCRDGDQSELDNQGQSVLHRAIEAEQWHTVKLLIQYHGNLDLANSQSVTPLGMLIEKRCGEIIDLAILWSPHLHKGINAKNETALHAVVDAGWIEPMFYLVTRGVDPLIATVEGESVLMYAVMNKECPQRMLAECIKLGFHTHQPKITDAWCDPAAVLQRLQGWEACTCPMEFAIVRRMPAICVMLYESGACSNKQLFTLSRQMSLLQSSQYCPITFTDSVFTSTFKAGFIEQFVKMVANTPRSLTSMCRLAISHAFNVRGKRQKNMSRLYEDLPPREMNYIYFNDITDPAFGSDLNMLKDLYPMLK